jgi:S-formylglutathione hydrolase FrmB
MTACVVAVLLFLPRVCASPAACAAADARGAAAMISKAKRDQHGFLVHLVQSPYQAGQTRIRVLLPDRLEQGKRYPVVYVLPVEAGQESRYGDGLLEVKRHDLQNKYQAIFVAPTFSHLPWYADHPSDPHIRQETYFLKVVVPFVQESYPAQAQPEGRLLVGFSKSGWGALSLLVRHPDLFGRAAAWDAPLMMTRPDKYRMGEIFGTQENFERFQISRLLEQRASALREAKRLILTGYGNFRQHHQQAHELMTKLGIPHDYRDGPARNHDWNSGWLEESLALLFSSPTPP